MWRGLNGEQRARVINAVCEWLINRRHQIVYSSVLKKLYYNNRSHIPIEVNSVWRFMALHITLAIQRFSKLKMVPKGNTLLTFDHKEEEERKFIELVKNPPSWSEEYYGKEPKQLPLNQIIDIPHFADSKDIGLLQVADFVAFFLRRYAEVKEGIGKPPYTDEAHLLNGWIKKLRKCRIRSSHIYQKTGRNKAQELFYSYASPSIRDL